MWNINVTKVIEYIALLFFFSLSNVQVYCQQRPEIRVPIGHSYPINSTVDISSDRKNIITSDNKTIFIWDFKTRCVVKIFNEFLEDTSLFNKNSINLVCYKAIFSIDNKYIFGFVRENGYYNGGVNVILQWDRETYKFIRRISLQAPTNINLSKDGKYIIYSNFSTGYLKCTYIEIKTGRATNIFSFDSQRNDPTTAEPSILPGPNYTYFPDGSILLVQINMIGVESGKIIQKEGIGYYNTPISQNTYNQNLHSSVLKPEHIYTSSGNSYYSLCISPNNKYFAALARTSTVNTMIYLWKKGESMPYDSLVPDFKADRLTFSMDGEGLFIYSTTEGIITNWLFNQNKHINTMQLIRKWQIAEPYYKEPYFIFRNGNDTATFLDFTTQKLISFNFKNLARPPLQRYFSEDNTKILSVHSIDIYRSYLTDTMLFYWGSQLNKLDWHIPESLKKTDPNLFIKTFITICKTLQNSIPKKKANLRVWDLTTGIVQDNIPLSFKSDFDSVSKDGKYYLPNNSKAKISVFDNLGTNNATPEIKKERVTAVFSTQALAEAIAHFYMLFVWNDYTNLYKKYYTPECKLLLNNRRDSVSFYAIDSTDWLVLEKGGYYMASKKGAQSVYYLLNNKVYSFEQFDVKYNRPDIVLQTIGKANLLLIRAYKRAYEKRIKKLGIDTTVFRDDYSVPDADFTSRDNIEYEQKIGSIQLHIKGIDSTYKLDRFNVWVNEVPIYGQRGISIRNKNSNDFNTTVTLNLSQSENRIETSITNVNGTESYRMPLIVNYTPAIKQKEMTRFIGIGIDQFADNKYNLQYSAKDIRDMSKKLKEKYGNDIIIDTLFNENVTISNVKALKQKLQQTTENDKVIVAYSGHGMLSKDYDYYLSTYSVNFENPEQNGLPYDELENLLDSIPARKKLMLIDACHSGEVDKEELTTINSTADSMKLKKGIKPVAYKQDEKHLGLKNSFELMQSLFVNVGKSTGATIISAAAGTQFALERGDLKNGVFTYSILEAMNKYPTLKISELKKIVGERVEQLTNGLQKPTSRNETIAVDWNVW